MGHSYGGLVAHEMARLLEADGEAVSVVLVDTPERDALVPLEGSTRRSRSRAYRALALRVRRPQSDTRPGTLEHYSAMFHRAAIMAARHRAGIVRGPILLITTHEHAGLLGWHEQIDVTRKEVGGDHNSMVQPPNVTEVVAAATDTLDAATRR
jgi:thioesterase domain-containing protein